LDRGRWVLAVVLLIIPALAFALVRSALDPETASGSPGAEFRVDADPDTAGIQDSVIHPVGASFKIRWNIDRGDTPPYSGYQGKMGVDRSIVEIVAGAPLGTMCPAGLQCAPSGPIIQNNGGVQDPDLDEATIFGGEIITTQDGTSSFSGDVYEVELHCISGGVSVLDLRPPPADGLGQNTELLSDNPTDTFDAQVTCGEEGAYPTPTPRAGGSEGGSEGGAGGDSGEPGATRTPLPGGLEAVPLVEGCQFTTWTGEDGTAPGELVGLVGPQRALNSLWAMQPPPVWKGYSPDFPEVSDLEPVDLLNVLAICMRSPGDFVRPIV
jgi:hypothetical protein